jgi:type IV secretory pathway TrbL component
MRQHVHIASRRRDDRLAMVRKLTLWITGGAAAASLGLGTAFATAVPGHAGTTGTSGTSSSTAPQHSGASTTSPAAKPAGSQHSSQSSQLSQPQQQPSQTTAPPVVTSGGS